MQFIHNANGDSSKPQNHETMTPSTITSPERQSDRHLVRFLLCYICSFIAEFEYAVILHRCWVVAI